MTKIMVVSEHSTTHMEATALHNFVFGERHLVEFKQVGIQQNTWMNEKVSKDEVWKSRLLRRQYYIHVGPSHHKNGVSTPNRHL